MKAAGGRQEYLICMISTAFQGSSFGLQLHDGLIITLFTFYESSLELIFRDFDIF